VNEIHHGIFEDDKKSGKKKKHPKPKCGKVYPDVVRKQCMW